MRPERSPDGQRPVTPETAADSLLGGPRNHRGGFAGENRYLVDEVPTSHPSLCRPNRSLPSPHRRARPSSSDTVARVSLLKGPLTARLSVTGEGLQLEWHRFGEVNLR